MMSPAGAVPASTPSAIARYRRRALETAELRNAIRIGRREHVNPVTLACSAGCVELVRTHVDQRRRVAVVAVIEAHDVRPPGGRSNEPNREFVGLAARVDEKHLIKVIREGREDPLGVAENFGMQVASVGVEDKRLVGTCCSDRRIAVTNMAHVVDAVEVSPATFVEEVLAASTHDGEGLRRS